MFVQRGACKRFDVAGGESRLLRKIYRVGEISPCRTQWTSIPETALFTLLLSFSDIQYVHD